MRIRFTQGTDRYNKGDTIALPDDQAALAIKTGDAKQVDEIQSVGFEPGHAIKINMRRRIASGDPGETDVFGAQQYAPLLELEIP